MKYMESIIKQFPKLTENQLHQFEKLQDLYHDWNSKINVISRKDIDELYTRHVLHSLGIAKVITFKPNTKILDVGTGGGFPGIPLAILFPEVDFYLIDIKSTRVRFNQGVRLVQRSQSMKFVWRDFYDWDKLKELCWLWRSRRLK